MNETCESLISIKQMLFATDFSRPSARALPYALAIAEKYDAKLYAAHIAPEQIGLPAAAREGLQGLGVKHQGVDRDGLARNSRPNSTVSGTKSSRGRVTCGRSCPESLATRESI